MCIHVSELDMRYVSIVIVSTNEFQFGKRIQKNENKK
jgi:hypothetical protein